MLTSSCYTTHKYSTIFAIVMEPLPEGNVIITSVDKFGNIIDSLNLE